MKVAVWIIAICEIIRTIQNMCQLTMMFKNEKNSEDAYKTFIRHLTQGEKEAVKELLKDFEEEENAKRVSD